MKKTLLAAAIATATLGHLTARADIVITSMVFGQTYAASGTLNEAGTGALYSIDPFFGRHWTAEQQTAFMDNTDSWAGTSVQGAFDYSSEIAAMASGQVAIGLYFDWGSPNDIAVLEIFDCAAGVCAGNGVPMANGPFAGSVAVFNGTGSVPAAVPAPATAWLMGTGLLGLLSIARRQ